MKLKHLFFGVAICQVLFFIPQSSAAFARPFDCVSGRCGIEIDAPYPNLVVGKIDGIATPAQSAAIFLRAQKLGLWHVFPGKVDVFVDKVQPISIEVSSDQSITVLAATSETRMSNLAVGQLVRFAPHRGLNEKPQPDNPYWVGVGCVILLCIQGDKYCPAVYRSGLYKLSSGAQLDSSGLSVVPGGVVIDVYSMRPRRGAARGIQNGG